MLTQAATVMKSNLLKLSLIVAAVGTFSTGMPTTAAALDPAPIPELAQWESRMATLGNLYCAPFLNETGTQDMTKYDAERVYNQMATYIGDPKWKACANAASIPYRNYVLGAFEGWYNVDALNHWVYSRGLTLNRNVNEDPPLSKMAVDFLATQSPTVFAAEAETALYPKSVEVAQLLMAFVDHMELGGTKPAKFDLLVNQALGHIDQWYVTPNANGLLAWQTEGATGHYPFHVGLTMQALIQVHNYQKTHQLPLDARIPEKIKVALDGLWQHAWVDADNAFYHYNFTKDFGDPKHNLLIAPAYAWYYLLTGDVTYRDRSDEVFAGGVGATISSSEDFNKNYAWSFDYVMWRHNGDVIWATGSGGGSSGGGSGGSEGGGSGGNEGGGSSGGNEGGGGSTNPVVCMAQNVKAMPSILWPPNHKLRQVQIHVKDENGQWRTPEVMSHSQNEPQSGLGRGDRMPDRMLTPDKKLYLRAERGKHGNGREYTVHFKAFKGDGSVMCEGDAAVKVPRDKADKRGHHQDLEDEDDDRGGRHGHDKHDKNDKKHGHHDDAKSKKASGRR